MIKKIKVIKQYEDIEEGTIYDYVRETGRSYVGSVKFNGTHIVKLPKEYCVLFETTLQKSYDAEFKEKVSKIGRFDDQSKTIYLKPGVQLSDKTLVELSQKYKFWVWPNLF